MSKKKFVKAANGTLIPTQDLEKIKKLHKEIIDCIGARETKVQIIIEALINAICFYSINSTPRPKLSVLRGALTVVYNHWKNAIDNNIEDILN